MDRPKRTAFAQASVEKLKTVKALNFNALKSLLICQGGSFPQFCTGACSFFEQKMTVAEYQRFADFYTEFSTGFAQRKNGNRLFSDVKKQGEMLQKITAAVHIKTA